MIRVLVVDDSPSIRSLLHEALTGAGFAVSLAPSAAAGLQAIREEHPDAVVLASELSPQDGVWCLEQIRLDPTITGTTVVMMAARPTREAIVRAAHFKAQGVVLKNDRLVAEILDRLSRVSARARPVPPNRAATGSGERAEVVGGGVREHAPALPNVTVRPAVFERVTSPAEEQESMAASVLQLEGEGMEIEAATIELKKLKPMFSRSELLGQIEGEDLRAMKPAVQRVLSLTGSSGASIDTIAKAIKQDQALSLKVLKIANSPVYSRGDRVETVQKAVSRIGIEQIRTTVLSLGVVDRFGSVGLKDRIKADWFWEHSIAVGLIASNIAQLRRQKPDMVDAMFTAGLLHDVGRSIYAERLGDQYREVMDVANELELPLETVESRLLLMNHADLTDRLLREWNFAGDLINPIALHHLSVGNIRRVAPRMAEQVATLGLANRLAHALLLGCSGNDVVYPIEEFVDFLGLKRDQVLTLCASVPEQTLDMKLQMLSHGASADASLLDETRSGLPVKPRALVVSVQPEADAVEILLERLAAGEPPNAPNLAVIRVTAARDRASLMSRLKAAEAEAGVTGLPALVVASGAGCYFSEGTLGARQVVQLVVPIRLSRLLRAIQTLLAGGRSGDGSPLDGTRAPR